MDFYTQEKIEALKNKKFLEQNGNCAFCGRPLESAQSSDLSHHIPQRKWCIKKWGKEIIHNELNMSLTHHSDICNSGVQISPNKTAIVEKHVENIRAAITPQPQT